MKKCFKCQRELPRCEFYKHPQMSDGLLGKCKECACRDVRANRKRRLGYYRNYDIARFRDNAARRESVYARNAICAAKSPEKVKARTALSNAVRDGRIERLPCEQCGCEKSEAHHPDYSKPLDVEWLCRPCHAKAHGGTFS